MEPYDDPKNYLNSRKYHTGKKCIEDGCSGMAGTAWSPYWCQPCNAKRMRRIDLTLQKLLNRASTLIQGEE